MSHEIESADRITPWLHPAVLALQIPDVHGSGKVTPSLMLRQVSGRLT